jgi:hypothetical protein
MSRPTNQEPAPLPERLARVTFFIDSPGRPGTGLAAARALVALESALGEEGTRSVPLPAEWEGIRGGAVVMVEGDRWIEPVWNGTGWAPCDQEAAFAAEWWRGMVRSPGGLLRLYHPDGRVTKWRSA